MDKQYSTRPRFGGRARSDDYYGAVQAHIASMRATATLREIADSLNAQGWTTPKQHPWNRERVAQFLHNTSI